MRKIAYGLSIGVLACILQVPDNSFSAPLAPLPVSPPVPLDNLQIASKIALGKKLFFDPILSVNGTISCASCHVPKNGFADPRPVSLGVDDKSGARNAQSVLNAAYERLQFWDGRAGSLEEQAIGPLTNPVEMANHNYQSIVIRLKKNRIYRREFQKVFGGGISTDRVAKAIAAFERTLVTPDTPYDRYLLGDTKALTVAQVRGFSIFKGKGRCIICHSGTLLSDESYHNLGASRQAPLDYLNYQEDIGRYAVTHNPMDKGRFKTMPLRNIALTAPYMHDGSLKTLDDVVQFYNRGGGKSHYPKDPLIQPLHLTKREQHDLVLFLKSLTGETKDQMAER